ncbi:helix-turn-helix domain-containing protein [Chryseobacterium potabilaquae]|uniref:Helix-turn-helix domain-containing protein n=1 Tax=Chryseobacterium potabilaquae TaxID=2675057 RepID=A0A6N4X9P7_9FLAO|nr:helix-turn-helix domain-containing protein [Chryseobacterium potabilaquae]CAA7197505.1 hypothetical protein CHRY9293_03570 [Chryseobacterium potabilaquae]
MDYLKLIHKFWEYNQEKPLGATTIALYLFLLEAWDKNECKDFKVSDSTLSEKLGLTRPTIRSTKEKLRNIGLIYYQTKNGIPTYYRLILDYSIPYSIEKSNTEESERQNAYSKLKRTPRKSIDPVSSRSETFPILYPSENIRDKNIPSLGEFITYAKSLEMYEPDLDLKIQAKYNSWVSNGWRTGQNSPITTWKPLLKSTLPYMKNTSLNEISLKYIPNIKRPKSTYNE